MSNEIRRKVAARLKKVIAGRPIVDIPNGPNRSYTYRLIKDGNPTIEALEPLLRAYGWNLAQFFDPWREEAGLERAKLAAEARTRLERILNSDVELGGLVDLLRVLDPGEPSKPHKSRSLKNG